MRPVSGSMINYLSDKYNVNLENVLKDLNALRMHDDYFEIDGKLEDNDYNNNEIFNSEPNHMYLVDNVDDLKRKALRYIPIPKYVSTYLII